MVICGFSFSAYAQDVSSAQVSPYADPTIDTSGVLDPATLAAGQAQIDASATPTADDIDDQLDPQNPGAFTTTTITLSSDLVDLSRSDIEWTVNGKKQSDGGIGARTFSFTTGGYGVTTTIVVTIVDGNGDKIPPKTILVTPSDLVALWEAVDSYVPPFYPGKKLPTKGSLVRVAAIPTFSDFKTSGDVGNYVYSWTRNGNLDASSSGYGRDYFDLVQNPIHAGESIEVTAGDTGNTETATADLDLPFFDPQVLFYGQDQSTGIISPLTKSDLPVSAKSVVIDAEPYFFSTGSSPDLLNFDWSVDGSPVSLNTNGPKHLIILKSSAASQQNNVSVSVSNANNPFQTAQRQVNVVFGAGQ